MNVTHLWLPALLWVGLAASGCSLVLDFDTQCKTDGDCRDNVGQTYRCVEGYCQKETSGDPDTSEDGDAAPADVKPETDQPAAETDSSTPLLLQAPCTRLYGVDEDEATSPDTILLGTLLPHTGFLSTYGGPMDQAVELAVSEINQVGGLGGKKFGILSCDTGTDAEQGKAGATHLADVAKVPALVGAAASSVTIDVFTTVAHEKGLLMVSPSATSPPITFLEDDDLLWRTAPSDAIQGAAIAAYLNDKDYGKVAVVNRDDAYGNGLADAIQENYCVPPSKCSDDAYYTKRYADDTIGDDQSNIVFELRDFQPDVIVLISFYGDGVPFINLAASEGFKTFVGTDGIKAPELITGGKDSEGKELPRIEDQEVLCTMVGTVPAAPTGPDYQTFELRFKSKFGQLPGAFSANSYDAMYLLGYAIAAANKESGLTGADVAAGLKRLSSGGQVKVGNGAWNASIQKLANDSSSTIDFSGASGTLDFDPATGEATSSIEMWYLDLDKEEVGSLGEILQSDGTYIPPEFGPGTAGAVCDPGPRTPDENGSGDEAADPPNGDADSG